MVRNTHTQTTRKIPENIIFSYRKDVKGLYEEVGQIQ